MSLFKTFTIPLGIDVSYHKIIMMTSKPDMTAIQLHVGSWTSEEAYKSGIPATWNSYPEIPLATSLDSAETELSKLEPFIGAVKIADWNPLEFEKFKKWLEIKTIRNTKEQNGFVWNSTKTFDSSTNSQLKLQNLAIQAQQALDQNKEFSVTWTLKDNTDVTLNAQEILEVNAALSKHIQDLYEISRNLRPLIDNAQTVEEVQRVKWPEND